VPPSSDVIVVGAGVIGCAVAYELSRRGMAVQVADDRPTGMGATHASAGMLNPYIEAGDERPLLDLGARSLSLYDNFVRGVSAVSGHDVLYRRSGTLDVALHAPSMPRLVELADRLRARAVHADVLDSDAVRREEPHLNAAVAGGLLIAAQGFVSAAQLTRALAAAARALGVRFLDGLRVHRLSGSGASICLETSRGPLYAGQVVVAAGSWAGQIGIDGAAVTVPVRPIRGQLVQLNWPGPPLRRVIWAEPCYVVPWDDGTVLVGATVEDAGFDERTTVSGIRGLLDAVSELLPQAAAAGFSGARAGLRPATPDELPIIGRSSVLPNVVLAVGHYRNGVLLAPLTAQLVASVLFDAGDDPLLELTRPQRFGHL